MANGRLVKYIYDDPELTLTWEKRFKVMKDIARGLLYLHEERDQTVLHRDLKAELTKLCEHGSNSSTTKVVGTLGYLAPEVTRVGKPTTSSDVFAYGALLLKVVCGRRPTEPKALPEELILVDWVWDNWTKEAVLEVVDSRLKGEFDGVEVLVIMKSGLMCSSNAPSVHPTMRQVVRYLEGEIPFPEGLAPPCEASETGNVSNWSVGVEEDYVDVKKGFSSPHSPARRRAS
ncbi:concanavalin A-like lectin protein kinase family protein [Artemisia annua]|uniref:Concanavalin A-like lectin protein kinase family protein n=1 Tax=Artemisia annua TaxID=35608 RepID=A0A2U1PSA1_ARTAN|nr:concanavalin A-like lectin protein kinase family protein [Artemisia annua]